MTDTPPPGGNFPPPPPGGYPPPPPGSGFGPPPGGNFPPPQDPSGYPPPPPPGMPMGGFGPQGGFPPPAPGYPPMGGPSVSVGDTFGWAWNKFTKNAVPLIVATLVFGVVLIALQGIINVVQMLVSPGDTSYVADDNGLSSFSYASTGVAGILVAIVGWFLSLIVGAAIQSAFLGGIFDIANGQQVTVGSFFRPRNIGNVVIAGLIVGVITTIGFFLCIVPGVIASFLLMFTTIAVLDRNLAPMDAIRSSFDTAKSNVGPVLLIWLTTIALVLVGALLCGVGLLVAGPVATLMLVYTYRTLNGGFVAPAVP